MTTSRNLAVFEQSLQTPEWQDQQAAEGRTPDEIRAVRSAAVIIVVNTVFTVALELVARTKVNLLPAIASVVLGYYLYKLRSRAENLAIGLSIIIGALMPAIYFWLLPRRDAVIQSLLAWGVSGAVLLLLGQAGPLRRRVAIALFVVLSLGTYCVAFALVFARHH